MTARSATARSIELPDLVGDKADQAIQKLRALGLMPVAWSAAVADVNEAGFVLGLEPPAGSTVRAKTLITLSVATHPDFQGHLAAGLDVPTDSPIQPPLAWPLSGPTGLAEPKPGPDTQDPDEDFPTAAAPDAASAPASPPLDAAYRELRPNAADSSAPQLAAGAAADTFPRDVSAPVPTPDQVAADAEWDRLRAAEAARHADQRPSSHAAPGPQDASEPAVLAEHPGELEHQPVRHDDARRAARRRSARRYRRLTGKQKLIVGALLALTLTLIAAAASGRKPHRVNVAAAHAPAAPRRTRPTRGVVPGQLPHVTPRRRHAARTRTVTVTVTTRAPTTRPHAAATSPAAISPASSTAPPAGAPSSEAPAYAPTGAAPSSKPASNPVSADPNLSGTGGGSTLQSPDGATAPPQP